MARPNLTGRRCQCTACGDLFNSETAFDRHRVGDFAGLGGINTRRCMTEAELLAAGLSRNRAGAWITSVFLRLTEAHKQGSQGEASTTMPEVANAPF
jgi:hypothetical protein